MRATSRPQVPRFRRTATSRGSASFRRRWRTSDERLPRSERHYSGSEGSSARPSRHRRASGLTWRAPPPDLEPHGRKNRRERRRRRNSDGQFDGGIPHHASPGIHGVGVGKARRINVFPTTGRAIAVSRDVRELGIRTYGCVIPLRAEPPQRHSARRMHGASCPARSALSV
jgi:hypothetical protein